MLCSPSERSRKHASAERAAIALTDAVLRVVSVHSFRQQREMESICSNKEEGGGGRGA